MGWDGMAVSVDSDRWDVFRCTGEDVDGEALIHLDHDELRELGIKSVGHRLSILKSVYNVKIAHGVPIESDNYVPVCMWIFLLSSITVIADWWITYIFSRRCRRE